MSFRYTYTPVIWLSVLIVLLLITLAIYSGRRRSVPGALPFMIACLFAAMWAIGSVMEYVAADLATKIFWVKIQAAWQIPVATAVTCFFLEYTWPGRWLTRRNLALLSVPPILILLVILTDSRYHLAWRGFIFAESIQPQFSPIGWIAFIYAFGVLGTINLVAFGWLFLHSPHHRWPVVLMLVGQFGGRILYMLERTGLLHSVLPIDLLGMAFEFSMYALALFGFRILDPVPLARQTAIEQLPAGVLVLDTEGKIVNLNPAASSILGVSAKHLLGRPIRELLPAGLELAADLQVSGTEPIEINLPGPQRDGARVGPNPRAYQLEVSALKDWRGIVVGYLLLLHDVTAQKQAQAKFLEQQRSLAMLHEREQLGRELHDGLGQVLGYIKMQGQAARDLLAQNKNVAADNSLEQLVAVAHAAQDDVREYILGAAAITRSQSGFLPTLKKYLEIFGQRYLLRTELTIPPDWSDDILEGPVEMQLLRIIQEALTNARKHAQAKGVQLNIEMGDSKVNVVIADDGVGFNPESPGNDVDQKYGLGIMRQRAQEVGGSIRLDSAPGLGTRVIVEVPVIVKEEL